MSSDLVAAFVMKPVGGAVHLRHGKVNARLVGWLVAGSVPAAFAGVLILRSLGDGEVVQHRIKLALGSALLLAVGTMVVRSFLSLRRHAATGGPPTAKVDGLVVRPLPTLLIGALGGLVVGMTSVGSGSLIVVLLLMLYPEIKASQLVGTDLIQAVPLVGSAALGHLLFGDFHLDLTGSLLIGSIPGVYVGARVSARAPGKVVRRALAFVLVASALKLLGAGNLLLLGIMTVIAAAGPVAWRVVKRRVIPVRPEPWAGAAAPESETEPEPDPIRV